MNASVQIKTHSSTSARNKNTHILRNSEAYENPRIIVLYQNDLRNFQKPEKQKPEMAVLKNEDERKKELNTVNSNIRTYQKRIEAIIPDDEQKRKRILKMEEKLRELLKKREELKQAKEVTETRGKKQKHHYIEFVMSITNSNEYLQDEEFVEVFQELQIEFLKNNLFQELELETNAIHLDQYSVHSHALFKLPNGVTWKKYLAQFDGKDGREIYKQISKAWHSLVKNALFQRFGITLENQTSGQRYKSLRNYKKQNPVQILKKEEKIVSEPNMSDLEGVSPYLIEMMRRAEANHELAISNGKSTQSESSSSQRDTEAQPSSSSNPKPQKKRK